MDFEQIKERTRPLVNQVSPTVDRIIISQEFFQRKSEATSTIYTCQQHNGGSEKGRLKVESLISHALGSQFQ